jgi:glycosyltransferase involved in cell wall biosynthesis
MNISVCMIIKDEEQSLHRSLSSIPRDYEVIILDTGSKDRSVEIAKQFGALVFEYKWNNDFSEARNICASYATGQYILVLDADEELPSDCVDTIFKFIHQYPGSMGTVTINNIMKDGNKHHRMIRLYPNRSTYRFFGQVHEQVQAEDQKVQFYDTQLVVTHYGYNEKAYDKKNKANRYLPMYLSHLQNNPYDGYMRYQLGKLYYGIEKYTEAEQQLFLSLQINETSALYFPVMVVMLGYVLKEQGKFVEAERLLKQYVEFYPAFPDMPFLLGLLAMDTGNIHDIEYHFKKAIDIGETKKYTSVNGVGTFKPAYNLGIFYEIIGDRERAIYNYKLSAEYGYKAASNRLNMLQKTSS